MCSMSVVLDDVLCMYIKDKEHNNMSCMYDKRTDHAQLLQFLCHLQVSTEDRDTKTAQVQSVGAGWDWSPRSRFDKEWYRLVAQQCRKVKVIYSHFVFDEEDDFRKGLDEFTECLHNVYDHNGCVQLPRHLCLLLLLLRCLLSSPRHTRREHVLPRNTKHVHARHVYKRRVMVVGMSVWTGPYPRVAEALMSIITNAVAWWDEEKIHYILTVRVM